MTDRPILFSGPMVRALLAGTKTQTRRVCKPAATLSAVVAVQDPTSPEIGQRPPYFDPGWFGDEDGEVQFCCPYGVPGDRLWVRETWAGPLVDGEVTEREGFEWAAFKKPEFCRYAADGGPRPEFMDADDNLCQRWTPGIHMFRWASRITLEVTGVRVERLQDISEADAIAEGVDPFPGCRQDDDAAAFNRIGPVDNDSFPIARYAVLWESINGPGSWDANPWVWVVEFRRV